MNKIRSFNEQVHEIVSQIPKGKVMSYKQIAHLLHTKAYRAVGNALNKNPHPISKVPCHRVIKTNLELGGYAWDIETKYQLLLSEGVEFEESQIIKPLNLIKLQENTNFQFIKVKKKCILHT